MKKFNSGKFALLLLAVITLSSCSNSGKSVSTLTGWEYNNPKYGGFQGNTQYGAQPNPPGMVLIEGGSFALMGTTMSPGFDFSEYEAGRQADLIERYPDRETLIRKMTRA